MLHKISLVSVLIFSLGCMKLKKKEEQKNEPQTGPEVVLQSQAQPQELDYDFLEESQDVQFHFPSQWPQQLVVEKYKGSEKIFKREISNMKGQWKDTADSKDKVLYKFFTKISDQLAPLDEIEIIPVLDLTLNEEYRLDEVYAISDKVKKIQIRHLELNRNAKLFIGAFKGKMQIDQLHSENGSIQTFPLGLRAAEEDGRDVGAFSLEIKEGQGNLNLILIAEAGAHGVPGAAPNATLTGRVGLPGDRAEFTQRPGDACAGQTASGLLCLTSAVYDCSKPPGGGHKGDKGHQGFSATPGKNGGSVEKTNLKNIPANLKIEITRYAGAKGQGAEGGVGGAGGPGGPGGDGAQKDFMKFLKLNPDDPNSVYRAIGLVSTCPAASQGKTGDQGDVGDRSLEGTDGIIY